MRKHPLHVAVGDLVSELVGDNKRYEVVKDSACMSDGRGHNLPLFYKAEKLQKSWPTQFTHVDILILEKNDPGKVKVIIEIEESNVKPINIFGKFFAAAMCSHYIYDEKGRTDDGYEIMDDAAFVQILEMSEKENSRKPDQWRNIEEAIGELIKGGNFKIKEYKIFQTNTVDIKNRKGITQEIARCLQKILQK